MNNKIGLLYFHQGWTDIFNCLALINYYLENFNYLYLLIRKDSKNIINFYTNNLKNIKIIYIEKHILDNINTNIKNYVCKLENLNTTNIKYLGIGGHDQYREDKYFDIFARTDGFFVEKFYEPYDIPYINRVKYFSFDRNYELENKTYENFISKYGNKYIVYHEVIEQYDKSIPIINLNKISNLFFNFIKILENSVEIHLLDSVWGAFVYLIFDKYKLFKNKKIILYAKRGYVRMFISPVKLENWIIR